MKYNFDEIIDRRGTNSYKWDLVKEEGVIPMWVADMDFQTAPCVIEARRSVWLTASSVTPLFPTLTTRPSSAGSRVATSGTYRKTGFSTHQA